METAAPVDGTPGALIVMRCPTLAELPPPPLGETGWPWPEETPPLPATMPDGKPWPKFSIVTPTYNYERFLERTIRSVLLQGYPNLEYVLVDGGSTDGTLEIIRKYDKRIAQWVSEPDGGVTPATNKGFRMTTGEVIGWIGSDDNYLPGALNRAAQEMCSRPGCYVINGDARGLNERRELLEVARPGEVTRDRLVRFWTRPFLQASPPTVSVFYHRRVTDEIGWMDDTLKVVSDYEWWLRMSQKFTFHYVSFVFAEFIQHLAAVSSRFERFQEIETTEASRRYWGRPTELHYWRMWAECRIYWMKIRRQRLKSVRLSAAYRALAEGRRLSCLGWLLAACLRSPWYVLRGGGAGLALRAIMGDACEQKLKQWLRWRS